MAKQSSSPAPTLGSVKRQPGIWRGEVLFRCESVGITHTVASMFDFSFTHVQLAAFHSFVLDLKGISTAWVTSS